ncbi:MULTISPECIES: YgiQ family radical SAM protein [Methylococcus]|uniref:YgiQ family radical SAM protein n=1 Tax=Methylococcus capsulatus TaxID=414 RepID=A0ABZ2F7Z3_METCP|nr:MULTISPECIES: YgiQ family radical SAM protein [Methylococcus]MDF9391053.1 YgiQ family radical SAM protein [Methylococcus capsulatus]
MQQARDIFSYRKFWAARFGAAPQLPLSRADMERLGWGSCDVVLVTGDAYVDHPSFGMALIGRLLEAQGFRVGILAQPDWHSAEPFEEFGRPNLFFGVTGGNMDSMVNRYTSDRRIRSNDAYTPHGAADRRPDRCVLVYAQRCREAYKDVPIVLGGIEASLRRVAHYDYWSDKVRRSVLVDAKADLLVYGNGERQVVEIAHRLAGGEPVSALTDIRGTAYIRRAPAAGWREIDSTRIDRPGAIAAPADPYQETPAGCGSQARDAAPALHFTRPTRGQGNTVIRLPAFEALRDDPVLYAHASRVLHQETNPHNARALVQRHGAFDVWLNPPALPLTTSEMDRVYGLPYSRLPHRRYGDAPIPAFEMIQHSVTIMRGCFGGCTFCSITEHEGRIIQSRSEESILREIETIRDTSPAFTGVISDLGGPTANMYRLACKSREIEASCRRPSCVYPGICKNLGTDHGPLIRLYRRARQLPGIKKILIGSGLRYDLAVMSPEYVKELVTHHVGGYLKIAPEHTEPGPLSKMMKPGIGTYDRFKAMFDRYSREAGKEQYLIPYFIAAHPGTTDEDMLNLALWLKKNGFRADQVQSFLPSPMAVATAMYHSRKNPLHRISRNGETVETPRKLTQRRLHKAFLRYHDPDNWPLLREALKRMGRADLIGNGKHHLVPAWQPRGTGAAGTVTSRSARPFRTQHSGLPPQGRKTASRKSSKKKRGG